MAEKIPHSTQAGRERNISYLCKPSTQHECQCLPSFLLKKPRTDEYYSSQTLTTNSVKQDYLHGKVVTSSNVLRPNSRFLKSTCQGNSTTTVLPTKYDTAVLGQVEEDCKARKVAKAAAASSDTSSTSTGSSSHGALQGLKHAPNIVPSDEQSETDVAHTNYYYEPLPESSSVCCSNRTSYNTNLCSSRKRDHDTDDSTDLSDNDEEPEGCVMKDKLSREGTRVKRSRNYAKNHKLYERNQRDKINKKMRMFKELIPNCNKIDQASILEDAIEYLKTLKFQLQIMSMGLCMPFMMVPTTTNQMFNFNTPHLPHLMGAGMGLRPGTDIPCSALLPQSYPVAPFPVINDNGLRMFGFYNHLPPPPFIPMVGNHSFYTNPTTTLGN